MHTHEPKTMGRDKGLKGMVDERAVALGTYIVENRATVRSTAGKFGVSKSTVHKDVSERLRRVNPRLYKQVANTAGNKPNKKAKAAPQKEAAFAFLFTTRQ